MADIKSSLKITGLTDTGKERDHNEDNYAHLPHVSTHQWKHDQGVYEAGNDDYGTIMIVADGMGGANAGEVASWLAIDRAKKFLTENPVKNTERHTIHQYLKSLILASHQAITEHAKQNPQTHGMGTTIVVGWIIGNTLFYAWVGDSRAYIYNPRSGLRQINKDHSLVQQLVDQNKITKEQAFYHPDSNIITQSLGDTGKKPAVESDETTLQKDDRVLLCSDGLNGMLTDDQIQKIIADTNEINTCARELLLQANNQGGHDNITIILADFITDTPYKASPWKKYNFLRKTANFFSKKENRFLAVIGILVVLIGFLLWQGNFFTSEQSDKQHISPVQDTANNKPQNTPTNNDSIIKNAEENNATITAPREEDTNTRDSASDNNSSDTSGAENTRYEDVSKATADTLLAIIKQMEQNTDSFVPEFPDTTVNNLKDFLKAQERKQAELCEKVKAVYREIEKSNNPSAKDFRVCNKIKFTNNLFFS